MDSGSVEEMPPPPPPADQGEDEEMTTMDKIAIERAEEQKLRSKYSNISKPAHSGAGGGGHSAFLQKRLAKGQKYFDSGDYQMAKQKSRMGALPGRSNMVIPILAEPPTGEAIPTPDTVPARKMSIIQPIHDASCLMHVPSDPAHFSSAPSGPSGSAPSLPNPIITKLAS